MSSKLFLDSSGWYKCPNCNQHIRSKAGFSQHIRHPKYSNCLAKVTAVIEEKKKAKENKKNQEDVAAINKPTGLAARGTRVPLPADIGFFRSTAIGLPAFGAREDENKKRKKVPVGIQIAPWNRSYDDGPELQGVFVTEPEARRSKMARLKDSNQSQQASRTKTTGLILDPGPKAPNVGDATIPNGENVLADEAPKAAVDEVPVPILDVGPPAPDLEDDAMPIGDDDAPDEAADEAPLQEDNVQQLLDDHNHDRVVVGNVDNTMSDSFKAYCKEIKRNHLPKLTYEEQRGVELMHQIIRNKGPLKSYDDIMLWHYRYSKEIDMDQTLKDCHSHIGRITLMKRLKKRYNMTTKFPITKSVILPSSTAKIDIVCHDAMGCIQSLLTDPRLTDQDYLFFNEDPTACPPDDVGPFISDVHTGNAYREAVKRYKKQANHVVLPIIMYIDGSETGAMKNLPIEALKLTLGIFRRQYRDKDHAWRILGYVPKISAAKSKGKKDAKDTGHVAAEEIEIDGEEGTVQDMAATKQGVGASRDYHAMLDKILESYRELQDKGFDWDLRYKGKTWKGLTMIPFVLFIKCDTKGADALCGSYTSYNQGVKNLCRYCICPTYDADNPKASHPWKVVPTLKQLVRERRMTTLQHISQHCTDNAFWKLRFSPQDRRGVHGACPFEILHAILLGLLMYGRDTFYEQIGPTSTLSYLIDSLTQEIGGQFGRQSERNMPKCKFTNGIREGKLNATEYPGILLVLAALLYSQRGREVLLEKTKDFNRLRIRKWAFLCEVLLVWHSYTCQPEIRVDLLVNLQAKTRYIMWLIKETAHRKKGMGLKIVKFHSLTHLLTDITSYGVPMNYDTGSDEKGHKVTKVAAKMTQKNSRTFLMQTANRQCEFELIDLAMAELGKRQLFTYYDRIEPPAPNGGAEHNNKTSTGDTQINIILDTDGKQTYSLGVGRQSKVPATQAWGKDIVAFLHNLQVNLSQWERNGLEFRGEHRRNGHIFRGHPNYRKEGPWRDWVIVDWGAHVGISPANIWCFLVLRNLPKMEEERAEHRDLLTNGSCYLKNGVYAVVENALYTTMPMVHNASTPLLFRSLDLQMDGARRKFQLIRTDAFVEPCFIIPDFGSTNKRAYFQIANKDTWPEVFEQWAKIPLPDAYVYDQEGKMFPK